MFGVVAVVLRVRDVCKPKTFLVHFQVDVAAYGVGILFPVLVRGDNLGCEPAFNFMSGSTLVPGVVQGVYAGGLSIYQGVLHHALHKAAASPVGIQFSIAVDEPGHGVLASVKDSTKVYVNAVVIGFSGPVHHHGRNLHGGAYSQPAGEGVAELGTAGGYGVGVHPHGIVKCHHGVQSNGSAHSSVFAHETFKAVVLHSKALLELDIPHFGVLVVSSLVPSAGVALGGVL